MSNPGSNVCKGRVPLWSPRRAPLLPAPRDLAAPPCFLSPPTFPAMPDLRDTPRTADTRQASGEPRRRHFLHPARGSEHRRAARPYTPMPHGPAWPGYTPRTKRRPRGGAGKCQAGDGSPERDRPPKTPAQDHSSRGSLCGRKHRPPPPLKSLFGKGLEAHSSASASFPREETAREGWGGPLAPLALTLSAAVPSAPLVSLPPGRADPPVRHSTTPPPCPGGPLPRLPRPPRRRAIGCPPAAAAAPLAAVLCPSKPSYATFVRTWRSGRTAPKLAAQRESIKRRVP